MADWKTRNYVPDSDDEEDSLEQELRATPEQQEAFVDFKDINTLPGTKYHASVPLDGAARAESPANGRSRDGDHTNAREEPESREQQRVLPRRTDLVHEFAEELQSGFQEEQQVTRPEVHSTVNPLKRPLDQLFSDDTQPNDCHEHGLTATVGYLSRENVTSAPQLHMQDNGNIQALAFGFRSLSSPPSSVPSSPLSEPLSLGSFPSSLRLDEPRKNQEEINKKGQSTNATNGLRPANSTSHPQVQDLVASDSTVPARRFRQRKAIQLNPYAIEGERYKTALKSRGMRPIHIQQESQKQTNESSDEAESGDEETGWTSSKDREYLSRTSGPFHSISALNSDPVLDDKLPDIEADGTPNQLSSSPPNSIRASITDPLSDDDELPDVDVLLCSSKPGVVRAGFKRRKTEALIYSKKHKIRREKNSRPTIDLTTTETHAGGNEGFPPSPLSTTQRRSSPLPEFRFPRGTTPAQLQTPATSSDHKKAFIEQSLVDEGHFDDISSPIKAIGSRSDIDQDSEESPSSSEHESEIVQVQRRIRGVLPASWLRLDQKKQAVKVSQQQEKVPKPRRTSNSKVHSGVARPIPMHKRPSENNSVPSSPVVISDDSASETHSIKGNTRASPAQSKVSALGVPDSPLVLSEDDESSESNEIDRMLPPASRTGRQTATRQPKYRQRKMTDTVLTTQKENRPNLGKISTLQSRDHTESNARFKQPRKTARTEKARKLRMSILDAIDPPEDTELPLFLRIAARTARSRKDRGKHSPTQKFLRLASREDTADFQDVLGKWREGTLLDKSKPAPKSQLGLERRPLQSLSGNELAFPIALSDSETDGNMREMIQPRTLTKRKRARQKRIDHLLQPKETVTRQAISSELRRQDKTSTFNHKGHIASNLKPSRPLAPAILEMHKVQSKKPRRSRSGDNPILERFLRPSKESDVQPAIEHSHSYLETESRSAKDRQTLTYQKRKRIPKRSNLQTPSEQAKFDDAYPVIEVNNQDSIPSNDHLETNSIITGLATFGTGYTTCFEVEAIPDGPCLDKSTTIGSGNFAKSLKLPPQDTARAPLRCLVGGIAVDWSPWNESVASQASLFVHRVRDALQGLEEFRMDTGEPNHLVEGLSTIVRYINGHLYFLDPVDRRLFLDRFSNILRILIDAIDSSGPSQDLPGLTTVDAQKLVLEAAIRVLLASNQLVQIASHEMTWSTHKSETLELLRRALRQTVGLVFFDGFHDLRVFLRDFVNLASHSSRHLNRCKVEALVAIIHILDSVESMSATLWDLLQENRIISLPSDSTNAVALDGVWHKIFTVLPYFDIDAFGVSHNARRETRQRHNWPLVKGLTKPIFEAYLSKPGKQSSTFNSYCQSLFSRCLCLMQKWAWNHSDQVVGHMFDFFARNGLHNLNHEECHRSPRFLEVLSKKLEVSLRKEDRCFSIFLKVLGTSLRKLRMLYSEKQIKNLVWRLMPNHGRRLPKDESVRQGDIDALRNHHDLLTTIYWAVPAKCRVKIDHIQNLVDLEGSHREACHISINTWSNLVTFQLSTEEVLTHLDPFVVWFNAMLSQILKQHKLARTEVENQVKPYQYTINAVSQTVQESTIAANQRQVEAILSHALKSLGRAISVSTTCAAAGIMLTPHLGDVFDLFNPRQPRINNVITQALDVIMIFIDRTEVLRNSDDSQGFGDWSGFEEIEPGLSAEAGPTVDGRLYQALHNLLSNAFGADSIVDDTLSTKIVQTWLRVAQLEVRSGNKSWADYINPYGRDSWLSLRNTEQTRQFTTFFLATLIELDECVFEQYKIWIFKSWLSSLVERESLLKFQHILTSSILNNDASNDLLSNPPFAKGGRPSKFDISLSDLCERRLSLLSCFLSNARESLAFLSYHGLKNELDARKQEYIDLFKHLMASMKDNYESLGSSTEVHGAYVGFVQRVVELLQQHITEIYPVDRFFTDSRSFPLPAMDPMYVVGRLKNYGLRLEDPRIPKQLFWFVQNVSERAATDNQETYLVAQLEAAMRGSSGKYDPSRLTLRSFLIRAIFPAYIENALCHNCGWILATPVLLSLQVTLGIIADEMDGTNPASVGDVETMVMTLLYCLQRSTRLVVDHEGHLEIPRVMRMLTIYVAVVAATLRSLDYLVRVKGTSHPANGFIRYFSKLARFVSVTILHRMGLFPENHGSAPDYDCVEWSVCSGQIQGARLFASQALKEALTKNWIQDGEEYLVRHAEGRRKVVADLGSVVEEGMRFLSQAQMLEEDINSMPSFREEETPLGAESSFGVGDLDL